MLRRGRAEPKATTTATGGLAFADLHDWVSSLPWVVERPYGLGTRGVRCFYVDCEPLRRRRLWLITGLRREFDADRIGLAVIVPVDVGDDLEDAGAGRMLSPMPGRQALLAVRADSIASRQELEALVLTAYACAMS